MESDIRKENESPVKHTTLSNRRNAEKNAEVSKGDLLAHSHLENIQNITSLLLKIENLEETRKALWEKLQEKEKKWI